MAIQVIFNQAGPLDLTTTFNAPGDEPMTLEVNGSVWTAQVNQMVGIRIELDGVAIGAAQIFSNEANTHIAVVPAYIPIELSEGQHTLSLALNNPATVSDFNDFYTAVIHF